VLGWRSLPLLKGNAGEENIQVLWNEPAVADDSGRRLLDHKILAIQLERERLYPLDRREGRRLQAGSNSSSPSKRASVTYRNCLFESNQHSGVSGKANAIVNVNGNGSDVYFYDCVFRNNLFDATDKAVRKAASPLLIGGPFASESC
jgi:hypothetical protein